MECSCEAVSSYKPLDTFLVSNYSSQLNVALVRNKYNTESSRNTIMTIQHKHV